MSPHQVALDAKAHNGERISIADQRRQDFVLVEHNSKPRVGGSLDICESYVEAVAEMVSDQQMKSLNSGEIILLGYNPKVKHFSFLVYA